MFRRKSKAKLKSIVKTKPSAPLGKRAYAVGDVHGRLDLLNQLLAQIEGDIDALPPKENHIIFLGDLIDRGPASRQVIERLINYKPLNACCHFIMGNHEEVLVRGLTGDAQLLDGWIEHGGDATAESYGLDAAYLRIQGQTALEHALISAIPKGHIRFLADFIDSVRFGDYLMVHAGVRPGVPIADQKPSEMRWIREEFLDSEENHGCVVIHGHTVEEQITKRENRIGIDTGAYRTGILSAVRLDGPDICFFQTKLKHAAIEHP